MRIHYSGRLDEFFVCIQEVSLSHLFLPLTSADPDAVTSMGFPTKKQGPLVTLEQPTLSSSGTSFPWSFFSEHHGELDVLLHYHPLCMDNHEYFVGPYVNAMSVLSYTVSTCSITSLDNGGF